MLDGHGASGARLAASRPACAVPVDNPAWDKPPLAPRSLPRLRFPPLAPFPLANLLPDATVAMTPRAAVATASPGA